MIGLGMLCSFFVFNWVYCGMDIGICFFSLWVNISVRVGVECLVGCLVCSIYNIVIMRKRLLLVSVIKDGFIERGGCRDR